MAKYVEQFERAKRYYERFKRINDGVENDCSPLWYEDDVRSFFVHCYHLKDWMINDENFTCTKQEAESFVSNNEFLSICADVCNGIKHLELKHRPRSGNPAKFSRKHIGLSFHECHDTRDRAHITHSRSDGTTLYEDSQDSGELNQTKEGSLVRHKMIFYIDNSGKSLNAFELATQAIGAWEEFISEKTAGC